ncbi:MAG: leucyl aminopeptidase [Planctomycetes bacterium]|nr:leucyl aminopeptidase [Planctomycetota bacterium]
MRLTLQSAPFHEIAADWLVIPVWEKEPPPADWDVKLGGLLAKLAEQGDVAGKAKEMTPIYQPTGVAAKRVLVVGFGPRDKADFASLLSATAAAAKSLSSKPCPKIVMLVPVNVPSLATDVVLRACAAGWHQGSATAGIRKSSTERTPPDEVVFVGASADSALQAALTRADAEGRATNLARELVNLPPCDLYPETFAERAREVAVKTGLEIHVLDEQQLVVERMNALLAVARGSDRPPRLVLLQHRKGGDRPTLALVGKGVTFDSGGLSLKPTDGMVDMKCDMAGAAAVLASMQAIAELQIPVNAIGIMALVENMPSGKAMKLGDVIKARNGKTIEVLNTDAEGRLILADALAYAVDLKASHLIDLATLTGACMVALGYDVAGVMSNNEAWSQKVLAASLAAGEKAWPLPMFPHYREQIKSDIADMKNTGGSRYAGAITAAKLLEEFVGDTPWVHLDIAGPAWAERENATRESGGTGCFVRTLIEMALAY